MQWPLFEGNKTLSMHCKIIDVNLVFKYFSFLGK